MSRNSFPTCAGTTHFCGLYGNLGFFPPSHFSCLIGTLCEQASAMEATEELWPGSPSGLFQRPLLTAPRSCRVRVLERGLSFASCWGLGPAILCGHGPGRLPHEDSHVRTRGTRMDQAPRASAPSKAASEHHVRHLVAGAQQTVLPRPPPPIGLWGRLLSLLPRHFHFLPFRSRLTYRSHPETALQASGNLPMESHPVAPGNLSFSARVTGALAARPSGVTSLCRARLLGWSAVFVPVAAGSQHGDRRDAFLSVVTLCPHAMAAR